MADVAERLAELHDIRLPVLAPDELAADALAAVAVGLALALLAVSLARLVLYRPASRRRRLLAHLAESRGLPPGERLLAQARLLERLAAELEDGPETERSDWLVRLDRRLRTDFFTIGAGAALRDALYRREPSVDPDLIERELRHLFARARL